MSSSALPSTLTILGLSASGLAAAELALHLGYRVLLSGPERPKAPKLLAQLAAVTAAGAEVESEGHSELCDTFADTVVCSPGIPPHAPIMQQLKKQGKTLISEVEFAWQHRPHPPNAAPSRWVGITGTNGKTTVTTLIQFLLAQASQEGEAPPLRVIACGNLGFPASTAVLQALQQPQGQQPTHFVVEWSSYQLALSQQAAMDVAVFTQMGSDHLNWHGSQGAYEAAKKQLFELSSSNAAWVLNAQDTWNRSLVAKKRLLWWVGQAEPKRWLPVSERELKPEGRCLWVDEKALWVETPIMGKQALLLREQLPLPGRHNALNALTAAAVALNEGLGLKSVSKALQLVPALAHRLEPLGPLPLIDSRASTNGEALAYNDSKATNPEASLEALNAFEQPVVLLAGGQDKGTDLTDWVAAVAKHCKGVVLFGPAAERFKGALEVGAPQVCLQQVASLAEAMEASLAWLGSGDVLLLSPACSSQDAFTNFEARGDFFKAWVTQLQTAEQALAKPPTSAEAASSPTPTGGLATPLPGEPR